MNIVIGKAFHRITQLVAAAVLVVNAALLGTGALAPRHALFLFLAVEFPLAVLVSSGSWQLSEFIDAAESIDQRPCLQR